MLFAAPPAALVGPPAVFDAQGGPRIIGEAQAALNLSAAQTADSWGVLRDYGNMLSPSVMFVLERVLARHRTARAAGEPGVHLGLAFSFSPGVGVEGIMLRRVD